jgi:hypothetical protein
MKVAETSGMFAIAFLIALLALCVIAGLSGAHSRHDESDRHRADLFWRKDSS